MPDLSRDVSDALGELMPTEAVWALASSSGLVAVTLVAWQAWRHQPAMGALLRRLVRWWLYDWWEYDGKRTKGLG